MPPTRKRILWTGLLVLVPLLAVWALGRAPSRHALEGFYAELHADNVARYRDLQQTRARLQRKLDPAGDPAPASERATLQREVAALSLRMDEALREAFPRRMVGWEVLFIPPGADRASTQGYTGVAPFDPSTTEDPPPLRGPVEIWLRPASAPARWIFSLGLGP